MGVLTKNEIIKFIKNEVIKIEPFDKKNVGAGSVDLTLDNKFRVFKKNENPLIIDEKTDYKNLAKIVKGPLTIPSGGFALGITKEKITLPGSICGSLSGRSRFARLGILVHATANFIQPGISNKQVLEIYNLSARPIILKEGLKICQLSFFETKGNAIYKGKFKKQINP